MRIPSALVLPNSPRFGYSNTQLPTNHLPTTYQLHRWWDNGKPGPDGKPSVEVEKSGWREVLCVPGEFIFLSLYGQLEGV